MIKLFTIGFTRKSALSFFEGLKKAGVTKIIDTRLNNTSQLAGFAKQNDLKYFLEQIGPIDYHHELALAPTAEILTAYKNKQISWADYEKKYLEILQERSVASKINPDNPEILVFSVAMEKLSWSVDRGRAYLREKFGKTSRYQLTESEAKEFLDFLKDRETR